MYLQKENYGRAIPLMERAKDLAPKGVECPPLETISLIFGGSFNGLDIAAQQRLCESLHTEKRTADAAVILPNIIRTSDKETHGNKEIVDWIADLTEKFTATLEHVGDEAFGSVKYDEAITQYSAALSLSSPSAVGLLTKRSRARAEKGLWEDAIQDANEAVKVNPSYPWGYEAKHVALHRAKRYDEAISTFQCMLQVIEQSNDPEIKQLPLSIRNYCGYRCYRSRDSQKLSPRGH